MGGWWEDGEMMGGGWWEDGEMMGRGRLKGDRVIETTLDMYYSHLHCPANLP